MKAKTQITLMYVQLLQAADDETSEDLNRFQGGHPFSFASPFKSFVFRTELGRGELVNLQFF